jgi:hypothetical protein
MANAQSADIFRGYDSTITFSAISTDLLDVIEDNWATSIGTDANGTCSHVQFMTGPDDISSTRGAVIGAGAALNDRPSRVLQTATSGETFDVHTKSATGARSGLGAVGRPASIPA